MYLNKTGCQWAYLPHDFPPRTTVNYHYMKWMTSGLFERVNTQIRREVRETRVEPRNRARGSSTAKVSKARPNPLRNPALTVGRKSKEKTSYCNGYNRLCSLCRGSCRKCS
ncbi:MAG: transposase [Candidatus Competibacteraceae bacterium]|nr:transposase [Candidatus Competibacteraceae bacterium]